MLITPLLRKLMSPFIHLRTGQEFRRFCDAALQSAGFGLQNVICETIGWDTVDVLVASGKGLGIIPELLTYAPNTDSRVCCCRISDTKPMRSYTVAQKRMRYRMTMPSKSPSR